MAGDVTSETVWLIEMVTRVEVVAPDEQTAMSMAVEEWAGRAPDHVAVLEYWEEEAAEPV